MHREHPADAERVREHLLAHQEPLGDGRVIAAGSLALTLRSPGSYNAGVSGERTVRTCHDYAPVPDDGRRYKLHDGELSVTPAADRSCSVGP